jgi:predicted O-methyltransferase YrrM
MADLLDNVRAARQQLHEAGPHAERADGDFERVAIPNDDADVLRDLLVAERAASVLEIGLAYGSSALAIAEALLVNGAPNARHVIVDAYQDRFHDVGWNAIVAAGLTDVCTLVRERSQLALPRLVEDGFVADATFVDGSHIFHNVFVDLCFVRALVRPGGLVVLDDCTLPSVATAARYFERNTKWVPQPIDRPTRLRAFRLPNPPFEPHFEDFTPFGDGPAR